MAVFFLRWFVPQLTCYGLIALFTALLNTRGKFAAPMFVPIANNLVVIAVLLWFHALVPHPGLASIDAHHTDLVLLGVGTTLGVVVQAALLVPSLLRARPPRALPLAPGPRGHAHGSPAWPGGPSAGWWPTRWPWWSSWPWPTGSRCREPSRPTPTPTPSSSSPTGSWPSR